jgi:hypothetical protein
VLVSGRLRLPADSTADPSVRERYHPTPHERLVGARHGLERSLERVLRLRVGQVMWDR